MHQEYQRADNYVVWQFDMVRGVRMIKFIAAIDSKKGIADDHGIPWLGKIPSDVRYYHDKVRGQKVLIGYGQYLELTKPLVNEVNYVATSKKENLREGFEPVHDAREFLIKNRENVWNLGGAKLFASTFDLADEIYLTHIEGDFHCTKFFPDYEKDFQQVSASEPETENGITFHFAVYKRKKR